MDQLRVGVIGVSGRGAMAANLHQPKGRSVVVAGADMNEEFLANFKKNVNPDAFTTTDYRLMLERDDVDAVMITVPDFLHEQFACDALQAGKHVYCEKPMAITTEGCDRMLETARASGKHLFVGHNMRYMDIFRAMKEIVDAGIIGEIKAVWVRHFVGLGGRFYYHDWHALKDRPTTLLLQKGSHDIDMIHWFAGGYTQRVASSPPRSPPSARSTTSAATDRTTSNAPTAPTSRPAPTPRPPGPATSSAASATKWTSRTTR